MFDHPYMYMQNVVEWMVVGDEITRLITVENRVDGPRVCFEQVVRFVVKTIISLHSATARIYLNAISLAYIS